MKLQSTSSYEIFSAELTVEHPSNVIGSLAIKRLDTGLFIELREVLGVVNAPYQILEVTPIERDALKDSGIVIAESVSDLQDWHQQWNGPK